MPRRCSSGSRSASIPVSARSRVVLPWSMWPAVPTTMVTAIRPPRAPRRRRPSTHVLAGSTVRRSSRPRPSSIRPIAAGVAAEAAPRSRAAERRRGRARPRAASRREANRRRRSTGASTTVARSPMAAPRRRSARLADASSGSRASARPGCRSAPGPPDTAPSVAATPASVDLVGPYRPRERIAPDPRREVRRDRR